MHRFFTHLLFTVLDTLVNEKAPQCSEYFSLLHRLLAFGSSTGGYFPNVDTFIKNEILWLKRARENVIRSGETGFEEALLEGHLVVCRELLAFVSPEKKFEVGARQGQGAPNMIRDLVDDFLFPASRMNVTFRETGEIPMSQGNPVCSTPPTISAAFDLLVGLCTGCPQNLKVILFDYFY